MLYDYYNSGENEKNKHSYGRNEGHVQYTSYQQKQTIIPHEKWYYIAREGKNPYCCFLYAIQVSCSCDTRSNHFMGHDVRQV